MSARSCAGAGTGTCCASRSDGPERLRRADRQRTMQTAPAVGEATFQTFDAWSTRAHLVGALWLLERHRPAAGAPARGLARALPLAGRLDLAAGRRASKESPTPLDDPGGSWTVHQHPVGEALAHTRAEEAFAGEAIETRGRPSAGQMCIITLMDLGLTVINGFLIVAVIGSALVLWQRAPRRSARGGRLGADAAAERDDRLDHVVAVARSSRTWRDPRGHGDHRPADPADRRAGGGARWSGPGRDRPRPGQPRRRPRHGRAGECALPSGRARGSASSAVPAPASRRWSIYPALFDTEGGAIRIDGLDILCSSARTPCCAGSGTVDEETSPPDFCVAVEDSATACSMLGRRRWSRGGCSGRGA